MAHETVNVTALELVGGHHVIRMFDDGATRERDLFPLLTGPVFEKFRTDPAGFLRATIDPELDVLCWANGVGIDAEILLYDELRGGGGKPRPHCLIKSSSCGRPTWGGRVIVCVARGSRAASTPWTRREGLLRGASTPRRPRSRPPATTVYTEADTILTAAAPIGGPDRSDPRLRAGLEPAVVATPRRARLRIGELCTLPLAGLDLDRRLLTVTVTSTKQWAIPLPDILPP